MPAKYFLFPVLITAFLFGCKPEVPLNPGGDQRPVSEDAGEKPDPRVLPEAFKAYWYAGVAEVSSYELEQARYGTLREGEAVLIYVTEPFDKIKQVKAGRKGPETTSVLKLNRVRKFLTGIYPYSIMSSVFYPLSEYGQALKLTTSIQEWCGHVFAQLNNRETFEVTSHSYFETEADQELTLPKALMEDELWTRLRLEPDSLPTGTAPLLPSFEYLRLKHQPIRAYEASLTLSEPGQQRTYTLTYPELNRTLQIHFEGRFPHRVTGWTETFPAGFGAESEMITSSARLKKTLLTPYWEKNAKSDLSLRDSLGLSMK